MQISKCKFQNADSARSSFVFLSFVFFIVHFALVTVAWAVPETAEVRVVDVTPSSFSLVWMTEGTAEVSAEVYSDRAMTQRVTEGIVITQMPASNKAAAEAARAKGVMKVRITGLRPSTVYFARTVTRDSSNSESVSYSPLEEVTTSSSVALYRSGAGVKALAANDLIAFPAYLRPIDTDASVVLGDLMILEVQGSRFPVSAFVGDGAVSPEGIVDLNNLFDTEGGTLAVNGGERFIIRVYRGGDRSTLMHYRRAPQASSGVAVRDASQGFFADINLDRRVDDQDFTEFRGHYRTGPNDPGYNPDYNFSDDFAGVIDIREFGKFSKEYGRTDVQ